jgi:CheY-like chemotaxis protein
MVDMPHKLLLADDSVTIQRVIELTFADEDVQVIAVGNGQEAIDRVQRDRPDIVLADVGMPERNGYEVAAFIKGVTSDIARTFSMAARAMTSWSAEQEPTLSTAGPARTKLSSLAM